MKTSFLMVFLLMLHFQVPLPAVDGVDHAAMGRMTATTARAALLRWLKADDPRPAIGQNLCHAGGPDNAPDTPAAYRRYFSEAAAATGNRVPLVCGVDYGWDRLDAAAIAAANQVLIAHWRRGGVVTISLSPGNPCTGGGCQSRDGVDYQALNTEGSLAHQRWMATLALLGDGLEELQNAGVPVLFRPLHEANGSFFWWCNDAMPGGTWTTPAQYRQLWAQLHAYLTTRRQLANLLWVFAPYARIDPHYRPVTEYLPDAALFDVAGYDIYADRLDASTLDADGGYTALCALGKPFIISEIGPGRSRRGKLPALEALEAVRAHCPRARMLEWWESWSEGSWPFKRWQHLALIDNPQARELLTDPRVQSLRWD